MITRFASVTLWVTDFEKALNFYRDILGLELLTHPGEIPHFKIGDGMLTLVKGKFSNPAEAFPPDFPQFSLAVENLDKLVAHLKSENYPLTSNIEEKRDARWMMLEDPEGNLIELVQLKT